MSDASAVVSEALSRPEGRGLTARMLRAAWGHTEFKVAAGVFAFILALAAVGPFVIHASAMKINVSDMFLPPIFVPGGHMPHILGTDQLGRDLLLRSLIGLSYALVISVVSVVAMFLLGSTIGIVAGYFGGWVDVLLMRMTDVQMSIPTIILAITILGLTRPTPLLVIGVLILAGWPVYARVARSVSLAERQKEYVRAAKILGASDLRIMALHIAPNILPPIAFVAVMDVARMMIFEAIFGFLGIGIQPPTPTFGRIIASGLQYLLNAWWITTVPGAFLAVTLCCINLMGGVLERVRNRMLQGVE